MQGEPRKSSEPQRSYLKVEHGTRAADGRCHDCAQGMLTKMRDGFEYWDEEGDGSGFWYCSYCGSNHVTIVLENGMTVEQGDLY